MASYLDWVREFCLSLPHTTEDVQWESHLLFRIAKKMYCITSLEPNSPTKMSLKCTPEKFAELVEVEGIIPAPYMARNHWVAFVDMNALRQNEIRDLIRSSYQLVFEKLPKKLQAQLGKQSNKQNLPRSHGVTESHGERSGGNPKSKAKPKAENGRKT